MMGIEEPRRRIPSTARTTLLLLQMAYALAIKSPKWKKVFSDPNLSQHINLAYLESQQWLKLAEYIESVVC